MRSLLLAVLPLAPSLGEGGAGATGQREEEPPRRQPLLARPDADRTVAAIGRGLEALRREMEKAEDGAVPRGDAQDYAPVGTTALAVLAFLGNGTAEGRGPHSAVVERALRYLLAKSDRSGGPRDGYISTDGDGLSRMHGHGYATLALAEALGMFGPRLGREGSQQLEERLRAAVRLIAHCQGETGGWYYEPARSLEHEGSVTVCLVQALRAARNAGIAVDKGVIDRALDYLRRSQKSDGSFRYQLGSDQTSAALTAAGVATLQSMGEYSSEAVESGIEFLFRSVEGISFAARPPKSPFPQYERFYTAQALFHYRDPKLFESWFRTQREWLLSTQGSDGSWDERSNFGVAYTTATNVLVLEIPLGLLPIFQR
ncbi:MAG TPA: prenyltransferase/squalene oxidase repeat-containing protein [Planctomycetota bacterium]|nr:prenyltransferase/squalene oxidase repeat-containing protein [Planctomycetota bacterium]